MVPHAVTASLDASATASIGGSLSDADNSLIRETVDWNPFDSVVDPDLVKGSAYTSAVTIINQAIFASLTKIFSSSTIGNDAAADGYLQLWTKTYQRKNHLGVTPFFHKFEVRSGAGNAILGFLNQQSLELDPLSVLTDSNGLKFMVPVLASQKGKALPVSLNVSAVDFDSKSGSLVPHYEKALGAARLLNYPVFTPTDLFDGVEHQRLTVLSKYVASLTGVPSVNLFDGLEGSKTFNKYENLQSVEQLGELYVELNRNSRAVNGLEDAISYGFEKLSSITGKNYAPFEYVGHAHPETVFVIHGTNEATRLGSIIEKLGKTSKCGLIKVRVPLPFCFNHFLKSVPKLTAKLVILSSAHSGPVSLKADISTSLFINGVYNRYDIDEYRYPVDFVWTPITIIKVLHEFIADLDPKVILEKKEPALASMTQALTANSSPKGSYLVWGSDNGEFLSSAHKLAFSLSLDNTKSVTVRTKYDNSRTGGAFQTQLISSESNSPVSDQVDSADVILVEDIGYLEEYDVLATLKPRGTIVLGYKKAFTEEDLVSKLSNDFKRTLANNGSKLVIIDFAALSDLTELKDSTKGFSNEFLIQYAFWANALPQLNGFIVNKLLQANGGGFELLAAVLDTFIGTVKEKGLLKTIKVEQSWSELESDEEEAVELPFFPTETSFGANPRLDTEVPEETLHSGYLDLAKKLTFREAYGTTEELRPDLPVKNFVVKVQENIRLTPDEYSRNIFHIEFDITGTGLTYDIGEALGIHGRNHPDDVQEFIDFYGLDGDSLIEISNKDQPSLLEIRSVRQSLQETLDFLGKPPKRFYEALAEFATDEKEKEALNKLSSSEGAADLKRRQEVDFCTYWDILEEFKSCRPPFQELVKIIAPLKRREYSIASSQRLHNNAVHLLIVVVDWTDSKGRKRWGHCSKYLSDLNIGDELVVSVKPSVMKLPPLSKQPIVMSGLGTGLAPFKAFIEEKIWQQEQGMEIGDIYLFMGSRHKKEEYLYGELWEAYKDAGILTHIGAAFSRDQPEKIYIQDKIREKIEDLTDAIVTKNGSFYLCGPTWPVPDITACLEDVIQNGAKQRGEEIKDLTKAIEDMKEEGRYILEVY